MISLRSEKKRLLAWGILFLIIALGLSLRLYRLGRPSLWLDELWQVIEAQKSLFNAVAAAQRHHGAAPIDYIVTFVVTRFGQSDMVVRLPAAIWGALSVYWIYRLGELVFSRRVGLMSALLLALNPFHIRYSQEVRFYSLFFLLVLISSELIVRAYRSSDRRMWGLYAFVSTVMLYTHYFGVLVISLHGLGVLLACWQERREGREKPESACLTRKLPFFLFSCFVSLFLFSPWIVFDALHEKGLPNAPKPSFALDIARQTLEAFSGSSNFLAGLMLIFGALGLITSFVRRKFIGILGLVWLFAPIFLILYLDMRKSYFYQPRQYFFVLPIFLLFVSVGIVAVAEKVASFFSKRNERRQLYSSLLLSLLSLFAVFVTFPALREYYIDQGRRDFNKQTAYIIEKNIQPGDLLLVAESPVQLSYYFLPEIKDRVQKVDSLEQLQTSYDSGATIWFLSTLTFVRGQRFGPMRHWLEGNSAFKMATGSGGMLYLLKKGADDAFIRERVAHLQVPNHPVIFGFYGDALRRNKLWALASAAHERAARLLPASTEKATQLMEAGTDAMYAGDVDRALALMDEAEKLNPRDDEIAIRKGMAYLNDGRPEDAVRSLEHARDDLHSDSVWAFFFLGRAYQRLGDCESAIVAYQRALEINPDKHEARFFMAECYAELGDQKSAVFWYQDYLNHAPHGAFAGNARKHLGHE